MKVKDVIEVLEKIEFEMVIKNITFTKHKESYDKKMRSK